MRRMVIEDALRWIYREELPNTPLSLQRGGSWGGPNGPASGHGRADLAATLWALPDNWAGVAMDFTASEEPHPDALVIQAVVALDQPTMEMPEDWSGFDDVDLHGLEAEVVRQVFVGLTSPAKAGGRELSVKPSQLLRTVALLGLPDMVVDQPDVVRERGANGKPRYVHQVISTDSFGRD